MGRPKKENVRTKTCIVRLNEEELEKLYAIQERYGSTLSEVVRKGIDMQYNLIKYS